MTFAGGMVPDHTRMAISDSENKGHIRFSSSFLFGETSTHVKARICKKRGLSNSTRKRERERERKKVLGAPHYHPPNLCQSHQLGQLETYKEASADVASKKPTGSVSREESISLRFWLELQHGLRVGKYSCISKRLSSATEKRRGNRFQRALADWAQRWYSWSLFYLQW